MPLKHARLPISPRAHSASNGRLKPDNRVYLERFCRQDGRDATSFITPRRRVRANATLVHTKLLPGSGVLAAWIIYGFRRLLDKIEWYQFPPFICLAA